MYACRSSAACGFTSLPTVYPQRANSYESVDKWVSISVVLFGWKINCSIFDFFFVLLLSMFDFYLNDK